MSVMKTIEANRELLNRRYQMHWKELLELQRDANNDSLFLAANAFSFGYIKGMRAAKAEQRKAARA